MTDFSPAHYWAPFEHVVDSEKALADVLDKILEKATSSGTQFAWRGLVNSNWALHSSLYRRLKRTIDATPDEEKLAVEEGKILVELRKWGLHSPPQTGRLSVLNQLALMQHFGAPTRLIDISFNAWVGVWFAVEQKFKDGEIDQESEEADARLFAINVTNRLISDNQKYRPWEDELQRPWPHGDKPLDPEQATDWSTRKKEWRTSVLAWKPSSLDARIFAQNGGFLLGGVPATNRPDNKILQFPRSPKPNSGVWSIEEVRKSCSLALRPHQFERDRGREADNALYTFRILASAKEPIRQRLKKIFGYTHATIYPDFTGFSAFGTPRLKS